MADYPVLFRTRHVVRCSQFDALIVSEGRCLITMEEDEWWCRGVDPGGLIENGDGPKVAFDVFRASFRHALDDLAAEAKNFDAFQRSAKSLFVTDQIEEARWLEALEELRKGREIADAFKQMERMPPRPSNMTITKLAAHASDPMTSGEEDMALGQAA